jgi:hypothetical protein
VITFSRSVLLGIKEGFLHASFMAPFGEQKCRNSARYYERDFLLRVNCTHGATTWQVGAIWCNNLKNERSSATTWQEGAI